MSGPYGRRSGRSRPSRWARDRRRPHPPRRVRLRRRRGRRRGAGPGRGRRRDQGRHRRRRPRERPLGRRRRALGRPGRRRRRPAPHPHGGGHRRRLRRDRAAGRGPARRRRRRDRARPLLGLLAMGRPGARLPLAHRPRQAPRQAADDPRPGRARRRPARPGRGGCAPAVVFHCFSGDAAMARTCVDAGYVLSFAGPVTFKNAAELRAAAALVPDGQLLVETDAPFLTPHPHRGRANEPYCLPWTVARVGPRPGDTCRAGRRRRPADRGGGVRSRALPPVADAPVAGRRGRALDVSRTPFGDHGVSRFASDCHRPLPFCHRQAGVGPLPSRAGTVVGVLPRSHGFGHRARAPAPGPTKSGCHVVDVSPRSRRKAAPARARRAALERSVLDRAPTTPRGRPAR